MLSLEPINAETGLGLFLMASSCSTRFIVVPSNGCMFSVQLDPSIDAPAFSCMCLDGGIVGYGIRISDEISFDFAYKEPLPTRAPRLGAIVYDGDRMGLNCRTLDGIDEIVWLRGVGDTGEEEGDDVHLPTFLWILYGENESGGKSEYFRFHALGEAQRPRSARKSIN